MLRDIMKKVLLSAFIGMLMLFSSSAGFCDDRPNRTGNWNFNETTGLINIPTARTIKYRTLKVSIRMAKLGKNPPLKNKSQSNEPGPSTGRFWDSDWWIDNDGDRRLLISPVKNVEINMMNVHSYSVAPILAGKWVALPERKNFPAIAVGVQNATGYDEDINVKDPEVMRVNSKAAPFVVASKSFLKNDAVDLTVGYGGGRFRNRVFYGGEVFMDKKHLFSAMGEYDGNVYSYGIKYRLPNGRWDFGFVIQDKNNPGFTFSYTMPW